MLYTHNIRLLVVVLNRDLMIASQLRDHTRELFSLYINRGSCQVSLFSRVPDLFKAKSVRLDFVVGILLLCVFT